MDRKFRVFAVAGGMHTEVETGKGRVILTAMPLGAAERELLAGRTRGAGPARPTNSSVRDRALFGSSLALDSHVTRSVGAFVLSDSEYRTRHRAGGTMQSIFTRSSAVSTMSAARTFSSMCFCPCPPRAVTRHGSSWVSGRPDGTPRRGPQLGTAPLPDPTCCSKRHGGLSCRRRDTAGSASFASLYGHRRRYVGSTPVYPTSLIS
jgi:hypothetical protein